MALPHREELLELALDSFAVGKNERMHELLVQVCRDGGVERGWLEGGAALALLASYEYCMF
jgi:hypothetical protein